MACRALTLRLRHLAVDDAGARAQACQRVYDQREAAGEVVARTAIEPHPLAVPAGNDAEAVVLDLMQPLAAGGQLIGFGWEARRDEPGRECTLQHVGINKVAKCLLQLWRQAVGLVSWSDDGAHYV